jgi:capsule polysaccharide export protein KpsE/RkpR
MKMSMLALALALVAPAAYSQTATNAVTPVTPVKHVRAHAKAKAPKLDAELTAKIKTLRQEIKQERVSLSAKGKSLKAEHAELLQQENAELAKIKAGSGKKADKKQARLAVRRKYAALYQDARAKHASERRMAREDIQSKRAMITKLRQS